MVVNRFNRLAVDLVELRVGTCETHVMEGYHEVVREQEEEIEIHSIRIWADANNSHLSVPRVCYDNLQRKDACLTMICWQGHRHDGLDRRNMFLRFVLAIESGDAASDTLINGLCHPLEGKAILNALDHLGHWGLDSLDTLLHRRDEVADVPLPSGSPLVGLVGKAFLSARHDEVQRCQNANTGRTHAEDL